MLNIGRIVTRVITALWIIGLILCAFLFLRLPVGPENFAPALESEVVEWPKAISFSDRQLATLAALGPTTHTAVSAVRYRLAGTFLQHSDRPGDEQRLAILDDLELNRQYLMKEGDQEGALEVVNVEQHRVEIIVQGLSKVLELSFQTAMVASTSIPESTKPDAPADFASMPALQTTAFGKQVATNQWVFKREALLGYYNDMMDNPERLANLYMSFMPDYKENDKIGGYQLNPQGEKAFLSEMGMLEGDVIRKVNSLEMTNQRRAEYFIGTFARDELNAVVLDIERNGQPQKLIYMIR